MLVQGCWTKGLLWLSGYRLPTLLSRLDGRKTSQATFSLSHSIQLSSQPSHSYTSDWGGFSELIENKSGGLGKRMKTVSEWVASCLLEQNFGINAWPALKFQAWMKPWARCGCREDSKVIVVHSACGPLVSPEGIRSPAGRAQEMVESGQVFWHCTFLSLQDQNWRNMVVLVGGGVFVCFGFI